MSIVAATELIDAGYSLVPVNGKAARTKAWQKRKLSLEEFKREYAKLNSDGVGLVLRGSSSAAEGVLLDFDCDGFGADTTFHELDLPDTVGWTSAKGSHWVYWISAEQASRFPSTKFNAGKLEIRCGAGNQSVIPPSHGREWHPDASLLDYEPTELTDEQLERVFALYPAKPRRLVAEPVEAPGNRPGDVYNAIADWGDLLIPLGCTKVGSREEGVTDWKRPGETDQQLSMTTGYCKSTRDEDVLFVFSTNFPPFVHEKPYSLFAAYALVHHNGDFKAAAIDLAAQGYVSVLVPEDFFPDIEEEIEEPESNTEIAKLLTFPGVVQQVAEYHLQRAYTTDPLAAAVAGLTLTSWMIGRKVMLEDTTRPNLSILLLGEPGSGKSEVRDTIGAILDKAGFRWERDVASGQALEDAIFDEPNLLFMRDEVQDLLLAGAGNSHVQTLLSQMKNLYSSSKGSFAKRKLASDNSIVVPVQHPSLTVLLLGVPSTLDNMPEDCYSDGFMARMLTFSVDERAPRNHLVSDAGGVPQELIETVWGWRRSTDSIPEVTPDRQAQPIEMAPTPVVITCTGEALQMLRDLADKWHVHGEGVERHLYRRGQELVCKLCLIGTCSVGFAAVDEDMVARCTKIVELVIEQKLKRWEKRSYGDSELLKQCERMKSYLRRKGGRMGFRDLQRNLPILSQPCKEVVIELNNQGGAVHDGEVSLDGRYFTKLPKFVWLK